MNKPINSKDYVVLLPEYLNLWETMQINPSQLALVTMCANRINNERARYTEIVEGTSVPWYLFGILHFMESGQNFNHHPHNGDPLTARTVNVPRGRPVLGTPPFTFAESAKDAIRYTKLDKWQNWQIGGLLYRIEAYNGFGYRNPQRAINSPYLWSMTNHYIKGKFVADGKFDKEAVSKQIGAAALLKRMIELEFVTLRTSV